MRCSLPLKVVLAVSLSGQVGANQPIPNHVLAINTHETLAASASTHVVAAALKDATDYNNLAVLRVVENVWSSDACSLLCKDDERCIAADYGSNARGVNGHMKSGDADFVATDKTCTQYTLRNPDYDVICSKTGYMRIKVVPQVDSSDNCFDLCTDEPRCITADYGEPAKTSGDFNVERNNFLTNGDKNCIMYGKCTTPAPTPPPPIDCYLSEWLDWGYCSQTCGGGSHTRARTIITAPMYGGMACGVLYQTGTCNTQCCPYQEAPGYVAPPTYKAQAYSPKPSYRSLRNDERQLTFFCPAPMAIPIPPPPVRAKPFCPWCPYLLLLLLCFLPLLCCCIPKPKPPPPPPPKKIPMQHKKPIPSRWWEMPLPPINQPRIDMRDLEPRVQERICDAIELMMTDHNVHTLKRGGNNFLKGSARLAGNVNESQNPMHSGPTLEANREEQTSMQGRNNPPTLEANYEQTTMQSGQTSVQVGDFARQFQHELAISLGVSAERIEIQDYTVDDITVEFTVLPTNNNEQELIELGQSIEGAGTTGICDDTPFWKQYVFRSASCQIVEGNHLYKEGEEPINEYLRLAEEYDSFCTSGEENFISWLRLHVFEFEQLLRRADIELSRLALAEVDRHGYHNTATTTWKPWQPVSDTHPLSGTRKTDFGDPRRLIKEVSSGVFENQGPSIRRMPDKSNWDAPLPAPGMISCPYWDWSRKSVGLDGLGTPVKNTIHGDDDYTMLEFNAKGIQSAMLREFSNIREGSSSKKKDPKLRRPIERQYQWSRLDAQGESICQEREAYVPKMLRERFDLFRPNPLYEPNPTSNRWHLINQLDGALWENTKLEKRNASRLCPWRESPKFKDAFTLEEKESRNLGQELEWLLPDEQVADNIQHIDAAGQVQSALSMWEHWMFASTRWSGAGGDHVNPRNGRNGQQAYTSSDHSNKETGGIGMANSGLSGVSVEEPCNSVHLACGHPLHSIPTAAFHPLFYLIHCNIDRHYEAWLNGTNPDGISGKSRKKLAEEEYKNCQTRLQDDSAEVNRYEAWLRPFRYLPVADGKYEAAPPLKQGKYLLPHHTFSIRRLQYRYDHFPIKAGHEAASTERGFNAVFTVDVRQLRRQSFQLHVFMLRKDDAEDFDPLGEHGNLHRLQGEFSKYYAGMAAVYGGKDTSDVHFSETRRPYRVRVDLTRIVELHKKEGVTGLADLRLRTWVVNANAPQQLWSTRQGGFSLLEARFGLEPPIVMGPLFEKSSRNAGWEETNFNAARLQRYLLKYGYYKENQQMHEANVEDSGEISEGPRSPDGGRGFGSPGARKLLGGPDGRSTAAALSGSPDALMVRPVHSADNRSSSSTGFLGNNEFVGDMIGDTAAAADAISLFTKTFPSGKGSGAAAAAAMCSCTRHDGLPDFNLYDRHRGPSLSQGPSGMCRNPNFAPNYEDGDTITWFMDTHNAAPAYIPNSDVALTEAVRSCFQLWNAAFSECGINVTFKQQPVTGKGSAKIKITWVDRSNDNLMAWSGTGGELAYASASVIIFDQAHHWKLAKAAKGDSNGMHDLNTKEISPIVEEVLLHQIGHSIGLGHSPRESDCMYSYYNPSSGGVSISAGDKKELKKLYGKR